jgi:hypothetical protein
MHFCQNRTEPDRLFVYDLALCVFIKRVDLDESGLIFMWCRGKQPERGAAAIYGMKRRRVKPIGVRSRSRAIRSQEPERLEDLLEDPVAMKRDMRAEQRAAFKKPEDPDPRVKASESDQGRTR